jgi:hypothetical protein
VKLQGADVLGAGNIQQPFFLSFIFFPDTNPKSIAIKRKKGQGGSTYSRLTNQVENLTMVGNTNLFLFRLQVGRRGVKM